MSLDASDSKKVTSSGLIFTGPSVLLGFLLGTDGVNDPAVTIYNGVDNTGQEIVPTCTYDASALGLNGAIFSYKIKCPAGIYVEIGCKGTVEVICHFRGLG